MNSSSIPSRKRKGTDDQNINSKHRAFTMIFIKTLHLAFFYNIWQNTW
jgi:hypothetical protein